MAEHRPNWDIARIFVGRRREMAELTSALMTPCLASCRLLHAGDSLASAKTVASSGGLSLFQGIRVLDVELSCFPCSARARHR